MQWRMRSFDPDRNGIRSYCLECNSEGYCGSKMVTDLDTWGDTEDITIRCSFGFILKGGGVKIHEDGSTSGYVKWQKVKDYKGGVVGMHYVRHGDKYFKATTSKNTPASLRREFSFSYR
jgi:hypothetical protein